MRFTLTYQGELPANARGKFKHQLRQQFHPQLKLLWETHPSLEGNEPKITPGTIDPTFMGAALVSEVGGHNFVSLVHPAWHMAVELDVLLLREQARGDVLSSGGDLDNQMKTLLDGLRRPGVPSEIPTGWVPQKDETPFHCLLDD